LIYPARPVPPEISTRNRLGRRGRGGRPELPGGRDHRHRRGWRADLPV